MREILSDTLIAEGDFVVHHRSWRAEHVGEAWRLYDQITGAG